MRSFWIRAGAESNDKCPFKRLDSALAGLCTTALLMSNCTWEVEGQLVPGATLIRSGGIAMGSY